MIEKKECSSRTKFMFYQNEDSLQVENSLKEKINSRVKGLTEDKRKIKEKISNRLAIPLIASLFIKQIEKDE